MNRNRIRVVGTGPDVESGESNLVYGLSKMLESLNLCLLTMEMCLTAEATELLRGSEEGTDAESTVGDGKGCIKDVFWNRGLQRLTVGSCRVQVR